MTQLPRAVVRADQPQRPTGSPPRPPRPTRVHDAPSPDSSTRRRPTRWCSPRTPPSRSTSSPQTWGRANLAAGDVVVLTQMEHHANIVPWHMLAAERGIEIRWIPLTPEGELDLTDARTAARRRQGGVVHGDEQRARHDHTGRAVLPTRPRRRSAGDRRRLPVRAAQRPPMCRRGTPTSSRSPATRCAARPASGCCGGSWTCSTRSRRSSVAAT